MATIDKSADPQKPKRFLTAYNFFFMHERAVYLESQSTGEGKKSSAQSSVLPNKSTLANASISLEKRAKRKHVKSHGKISFANLSKHISTKWKGLSPEERKVFNDLAKKDLERYRKEKWVYEEAIRAKASVNKDPGQNKLNDISTSKSIEQNETVKVNSCQEGKMQEEDETNLKKETTTEQTKREPIKVEQNTSHQVLFHIIHQTNDFEAVGLGSKRPLEETQRNVESQSMGEHKEGECFARSATGRESSTENLDSDRPNGSRKTKDEVVSKRPLEDIEGKGEPHSMGEQKEVECFANSAASRSSSSSGIDDDRPNSGGESEDELGDISIGSEAMDSFTIGSFAQMSIDTPNTHQGDGFAKIVHEGQSTRIFRVSNEIKKFSGCTGGAYAIKVLTDQFPENEQISRIENEYKLLQHLSRCSATRRVFEFGKHEGFYAIHFEWLEGVTLKEWIKTRSSCDYRYDDGGSKAGGNERMESAVRLALKISEALAELHGSGVVHNNITSDNIIVEADKGDGRLLVKFIDLGLASFSISHDYLSEKPQTDLCSLGIVFFELFIEMASHCSKNSTSSWAAGATCDKEREINGVSTKKEKHLSPLQHDRYTLLRSSVPLCLSTMIYNLIEKRDGYYYYRSIEEVIQELSIMLSDVGKFLHTSEERSRNPFHLQTNKFYGRAQHVSKLIDSFKRVSRRTGSCEMVIVSGYSGAGKSALVQQVKAPMTRMGGNFLCGKFDQLQQMEPLSAITNAFSDFCSEMAAMDASEIHKVRSAIQEVLGSETSVLLSLIPSLSQITGTLTSQTVQIGCKEAQNRLKYVFRLFVRAISSPAQPLVLFLDDLQWADHVSLDLIESLVTDAENTSLLFIGTYRENEVDGMHPLSAMVRKIESRRVDITKIEVSDLSKEDTNELLSEMIQTPVAFTQSLTDIVYRKTSGNMLFVLQFLQSLCDEYLLYYSLNAKQWQWDTSMIESKDIADNAVELMSRKILQFPKVVQNALKLIACLGSFCEESHLNLISSEDEMIAWKSSNESSLQQAICFRRVDLSSSLEYAVKEGVMDFVDSKYRFVHDQIQFASYSLIPENMKGHWHLWIGNQVWANRAASPEKALFIAVGQLNKGAMLIHNTNHRIDLARLNLEAGRQSISVAAFVPAAFYSKMGISLLNDTCWSDHYNLCLRLHDSYAEAEYCKGNFGEMKTALDTVFANAKCFDDQLFSYFTLVNALGTQGKPQEAVKIGLFVLSKLGEPIDTSSSDIKDIIKREFLKTKQILDGKTDKDILAMNTMVDHRKIAAMRFMNILSYMSFYAKMNLHPIVALRMVQVSLYFGLCNESAFGFASYGCFLCCKTSDISGAHRFGKLSLLLLETSKSKECLARVYTAVYSLISPWVEHCYTSLEQIEYGYKVGMRYGDIRHAMVNAQQFCIHAYQCGVELGRVENKIRDYSQEMIEHKQDLSLKMVSVYRQAILNLMGHSRDPLQLSGDAMDQDHVLREALKNNQIALVCAIYHQRSWLAYLFGDYKLASEMVVASDTVLNGTNMPTFWMCNHYFLSGLISLALAHDTNERKWMLRASNAAEKVKNYAQHVPSNYQHKLLLLEAESASLLREYDQAAKKYDAAIKAAGENGFIQDRAVAYERAGLFHFKRSNNSMSSHCYGEAHFTYLKWGAQGKANHLRERFPF